MEIYAIQKIIGESTGLTLVRSLIIDSNLDQICRHFDYDLFGKLVTHIKAFDKSVTIYDISAADIRAVRSDLSKMSEIIEIHEYLNLLGTGQIRNVDHLISLPELTVIGKSYLSNFKSI